MNDDIKPEDQVNTEDTDLKETQAPEEVEETAKTEADQPAEEISETPTEEQVSEEEAPEDQTETSEVDEETDDSQDNQQDTPETPNDNPAAKWYVVHTYSGHENKVAAALKQRVESEHLEKKIIEVLVPTQEKIEIRGGKKETVKEKIFPGYILVKMVLDDDAWLAVRTTQGVTSFIGMSSKPTPIPDYEVKTIIGYMQQGGQPTYKQIFSEGDTVKIVDGPFAEFIGKIESVDKEKGKIKVLVSIFGRETPVELDFLQVAKL